MPLIDGLNTDEDPDTPSLQRMASEALVSSIAIRQTAFLSVSRAGKKFTG